MTVLPSLLPYVLTHNTLALPFYPSCWLFWLKDSSLSEGDLGLTWIGCMFCLQAEIAREGGIPPLVSMLQTGTDEFRESASNALRALAMNNDKNKVYIPIFVICTPIRLYVRCHYCHCLST